METNFGLHRNIPALLRLGRLYSALADLAGFSRDSHVDQITVTINNQREVQKKNRSKRDSPIQ